MVLLRDQPADGDCEGRVGGNPHGLGCHLGVRGRELVESVRNRDELLRCVARRFEEAPDGVRDRDQPPRATSEGSVDVAERPEQVPIVVVPGREVWDPQRTGRDRAVDVTVHEVRMDEVGSLCPDRADHIAGHARADVDPASHLAVRDAQFVEVAVEELRVAPGYVEADEAGVEPSRPQSRQECEEVVLGAADAGELVDVDDLHRASTLR